MPTTRAAVVFLLLCTSVTSEAICPIGDGLGTQDQSQLSPADEQEPGPTTYRLAGEMVDGTKVLHAVDGRGSPSELHELLLVRRASELNLADGESSNLITIGGEDYVIEKVESVQIDQPCAGTVSVEGNDVVMTIVAP